jgi:hypothetical protein
MIEPSQRKRKASAVGQRGFSLVASMLMMTLLMGLGVGLLSLASIELRHSGHGVHQARAQANARLALAMALNELQRHVGPDTRATATASILGQNETLGQPNWTGVWDTRPAGPGGFLQRDDRNGGLRDVRNDGWNAADKALAWLVSGSELGRLDPRAPLVGDTVDLVGPGSLGAAANATTMVGAPKVPIGSAGEGNGHYAWWVGDLGVKANIATPDAHEDRQPDPAGPGDGGWFRLLASQEADAGALTGSGAALDADAKRRLPSESSPEIVGPVARDRMRAGFHDFTTHSEMVLADMAHGGLKRDLTAYFQSTGAIPDKRGLPGLRDADHLVGPANPAAAERDGETWTDGRHRHTSPRFGLLRKWATLNAPFDKGTIAAIPPKSEPSPRIPRDANELALSNNQPASLASLDTPALVPVLVEGSMQFSLSWFRKVPAPGEPLRGGPFDVRQHFFPRVVLWNPYNIELTLDRSIVVIQGNGRQEVWMDGIQQFGNGFWNVLSQWIFFEGGRDPNFGQGREIINSSGYLDPYIGSFYFTIPRTTFGPGECLVFSPDTAGEYNGTIIGKAGSSAIDTNLLTCTKPPHPSRNFYMSDNNVAGGISFMPTFYWFAPTQWWTQLTGRKGIENQGDDCRVILKQLGSRSNISFEEFDSLPQLALISASMQFGGGREPRIAWNINEKMPLEELSARNPVVTRKPNVRTREGIRLRWFDEHLSNELGAGALAGTPHFQEALMASWNLRAAYSTRSPFDNIAGSLPVSGTGGGPWFFGAYTRDLYDEAVSWDSQMPVPRGGKYHGNPFGPPQESGGRPIILFDVPRQGSGVISIGQFQHAKLSEFIWHPAYAVGQSLADPRLGGLDRTAPRLPAGRAGSHGGFNADRIGWSSDTERSQNRDSWARKARAIYQEYPETDQFVYDLSYELNRTLWDSYFLSTGDAAAKRAFLADPVASPLPNGRIRRAPLTGPGVGAAELADFHLAARHLTIDGGFNVNSTSVDAWKAVLNATRRVSGGNGLTPFPRVLTAPGGEWSAGDTADADAAWSGGRALNDAEIDRLARAIVAEVRARGPFLSLADFVNRRLAANETGRMGPLQAAIEKAGLNAPFHAAYPLDNDQPLKSYRHPDNISEPIGLDQTLKPDSKVWGIPGYLTQGDLLQVLGPALNARSDTFIIRTYGDSLDETGKIVARAWCEAVVQRTSDPLQPDASGLNSARNGQPGDLGRRFVIKSFRWLGRNEV